MVRIIILVAATVAFFSGKSAEAQQHYNSWFRSTLAMPVNKKIRIDSEFQHRRQNGFDDNCRLDKSLMFTFRNWVHYQQNNDVVFSVSPFAWFSNYKIVQKPEDETATPKTEIRVSAATDIQHQIFNGLYLTARSAVEYRIFTHDQADIIRFRTRFGIRYQFNRAIKVVFYDELLLNLKGVPLSHLYDHNRVGFVLEYKILPDLKLEVGYLKIARLPLNELGRLYENNLLLNVNYKIGYLKKP